MAVILHIFLLRDVGLTELLTLNLRLGNNPQVKRERESHNSKSSHEIGPHKTSETHTSRQHSDNLGLVRHLRGEEDYRDEGEQSAELIDEVGDEVDVVVENDSRHRGVGSGEVIDTLRIVEDDQNDGNHRNSEDVGAQKLTQDIAVKRTKSWE